MGTTTAKFFCNIRGRARPRDAAEGAPRAVRPRPSARRRDANVKAMSNEHNFVFCATPYGFLE
jgi:hypothetical protein